MNDTPIASHHYLQDFVFIFFFDIKKKTILNYKVSANLNYEPYLPLRDGGISTLFLIYFLIYFIH